jgi:mono/diheme cytochrome c family protein
MPLAVRPLALLTAVAATAWATLAARVPPPPPAETSKPPAALGLVRTYCQECHSAAAMKGSLDLERFTTADAVRRHPKVWLGVAEMVEAGEMPPKGKPQFTDVERRDLLAWVRGQLDAAAKARAGDPGFVPLRRLSNAEYDATVRDLTGIDLRPAREFPADGAAGEGFTNAAEALTDVSPALLTKYLNAAKSVASHAVLLPDGFRFEVGMTRRDWTDASIARLRDFYRRYTNDFGEAPLAAYLSATLKHRDGLRAGTTTPEKVAAAEKLHAKYLKVLWEAFHAKVGEPLAALRVAWANAGPKDVPALVAQVKGLQKQCWKPAAVGSYRSSTQRVPVDPSGDKAGWAEFRAAFPQVVCFAQVVPNDEVVSLKMFHREDEPLECLFLDDSAKRELDDLWREHAFVSRQPEAENAYLPQFIGFVTQDQPKETLAFFEAQRPAFQKRADDFARDLEAAAPRQMARLLAFATETYRRPLTPRETAELPALYASLCGKGLGHDDAMRDLIARILVAPAFLFRVEVAPAGTAAGPVGGYELATRLSYFLWSSMPDAELRTLAAAGKLTDSAVIEAQMRRMIADPRARALAVEFGTQWLHVRDFGSFTGKSETAFPDFTADLRKAMDEEGVRFFLDFFQSDRGVTDLLDGDRAFLNETLAKHYGVPGVSGPEFRRVDGVRQYGRGGVLGLGSVLSKQAAAARTSPTLRGDWVSETLLGEKLPRPPPDVPKLPEESAAEKLTVRQLTARHAADPACAHCHVRIDPYGFALETFDGVGRRRDRDSLGLPVDAHATLRDGTEFDGPAGLKNYLLTQKRAVVTRLFCKKLLGYALGRAVAVSDTSLIDDMVRALDANTGKVSAAIAVIVRSPAFRNVRGADFTGDGE